ncbi:MAG: hypothetical protein WD535_01610, partial [Thermaerobacterales bacterium]
GPGSSIGPRAFLIPEADWNDATELPAAEAAVDLTDAAPGPVTLLLRAQVPATVILKGPPDLKFGRFQASLQAKPLVRDLSRPLWGTDQSDFGITSGNRGREYLLSSPQRLTRMRIRTVTHASVAAPEPYLAVRTGSGWRLLYFDAEVTHQSTLADYGSGGRMMRDLLYARAHDLDGLSISGHSGMGIGSVLLASPSEPSRISVAAGDDSPLQTFPFLVEPGETVVTRDLAAELNRLWDQAVPAGAHPAEVAVPLKITSLTDGIVTLSVKGAWQRLVDGVRRQGSGQFSTSLSVNMNPFHPVALEVPWPADPAADTGVLEMELSGEFTGGLRRPTAIPASGRPFAVRVTESLEVAQAVLINPAGESADPKPGPARELTALWLALSEVPAVPQTIELRLAAAAGSPPAPAGSPLARVSVELPADTAAYAADPPSDPTRFWLRAPFDDPVTLDGSSARSPLFLICAGSGAGVLLAHYNLVHLTADGGRRVPLTSAEPGVSLVRNLVWKADWERQIFDGHPARWLCDVELVPVAGEIAAGLLQVSSLPGLQLRPSAMRFGPVAAAAPVSRQPGGVTRVLTLQARAAGTLDIRARIRQSLP